MTAIGCSASMSVIVVLLFSITSLAGVDLEQCSEEILQDWEFSVAAPDAVWQETTALG